MSKRHDFRSYCLTYLEALTEIPLPDIELDKNNETILIELYRREPHIEVLLRNLIIKLDKSFSHTVVCGQRNEHYIRTLCENISPNIHIVVIDIYESSINLCNNLMYEKSFWNLFAGEKLLVYQEDSFLFGKDIEPFMKYDFIGAPWYLESFSKGKPHQGNGGFSIRTKAKLIEALQYKSHPELVIHSSKTHGNDFKLDNYPEDIFYSTVIRDFKLGLLPSAEVAYAFSTENLPNKNALAGHQFWNSNENWKTMIDESLVIDI